MNDMNDQPTVLRTTDLMPVMCCYYECEDCTSEFAFEHGFPDYCPDCGVAFEAVRELGEEAKCKD